MECTERLYIENSSTLKERITRIDNIIEALELQMLNVGVDNSDVQNYSLDDGQVKISTLYRSPSEIANAIDKYTRIRERLINKLNGRGFVLRPWRGLR